MKRKSLTMILCLLTCLSLVGVGFAAWVISSGDTESVSGNITVDTVSDKRFTFLDGATSSEVHFGMDDSAAISNAWLTNDVKNSEKLEFSFEIQLEVATALDSDDESTWNSAVTVSAAYSAPNSEAYENAIKAGAIIAPSSLTVEFVNASTKIATYKVSGAFSWGEAFDKERTAIYVNGGTALIIESDTNLTDNVNPYEFYNTGKTAEAWGDDAYYYLNLIQLMETLSYNVTVTATPATSSN